MDPQKILERRLERERAARKQAEALLETKSLELDNARQELRALAAGLEARVDARAQELTALNAQLTRETLERERMQDILRERESSFTTLFESSSVAVLLVDENARIILANARACEMFGYAPSELANQPFQKLVPLSKRDTHDARVAEYFRAPHNRPMGAGLELVAHKSDGSEFPVDISLGYVQTQTGMMAMAWVSDLTERRRTEAALRDAETRYRTLVEQAPSVMYTDALDKIGTPLYVSPQIETLTGYTPKEWISNPALRSESVFPQDRARAAQAVREISKTGEPLSLDYRMVTRAGKLIWVHDETRLVCDEQDKPLYAQGFLSDITARKQAEAALELSANILDSIVNLVVVGNSQGEITYVSPSVEKILGYTAQELLGDGWWRVERASHQDLENERNYVMAAAAGTIPTDDKAYEHRFRHKNGEWRWLVIEDAKGPNDLLIGVATDITGRKRAEDALRASESFYHTLVDVLPMHLCRKDHDGRFTFGNRLYLEEMKCSLEELVGKTDFDFHPREMAALYRADDQRVVDSGTSFETVESHETLDGTRAFVQVIKTPIREADGKITGVQIMYWDVTERERIQTALRESEERFHSMFEKHDAVMLLIEPGSGKILDANIAAAEYYGYSQAQLTAMSIDDVNALPREQVAAERALAAQEKRNYFVFPHRLANGEVRTVEVHSSPINLQGKPLLFSIIHDVTERTKIEEALRESETRYRDLVESASDIIYRTDAEGYFTYANPVAVRLMKFASEHQVVGKHFAELIRPDARHAAQAFYTQQIAGRIPNTYYEFPALTAEGHSIWIGQNVQTLLHQDEVVGMQAVARDITARKSAEDALRDSREQLNSILASMDDVVWAISLPDLQFLFLNSAAERVYHRTVAEFMENPALWLETVHPEDRAVVARKQAEAQRAGAEVEHRIQRPNGEVRWLLSRIRVARDAHNTPIRLDGIATDITERKHAQEEIRAQRDFAQQVMNTMGQGLTVTNAQGNFEFVNPAYAKMLGVSPVALIGKSPYDVTDTDFHGVLSAAWERRRAGETTTYETRLKHADGHLIPVLITSTPRWRDTQVRGSIAVITDLTAQKRLEEALATARDQALEASRLKSEFLAMMSHEIRTPMNSIVGMTELLLDTPLDDEQRDFANIAHESSHVLLNIINDILDFSKIEAGKLLLDRAEFDLTGTVEGAAEIVSARAREKQIPLMTYISPALPQIVIGDSGRLRQVLLNLLSNAIKFTEHGHVLLNVNPVQEDEHGMLVEFRVQDTGIGIAHDIQERLFQPFTQADGSITRRYGGTGLGLAISKRLVEMMNGEIGVTSEPGAGSTFWFTTRLERSTLRVDYPPIETDLTALRVLIVDDYPEHGMILRSYLDGWDIPNTVVTDAEAALQTLRDAQAENNPFTVAIYDWNMPQMNGFALAQETRTLSELKNLKLILVTAYDTAGLGEQAIAKGFAAYLTKPLRQSQLREAIRHAVTAPPPKPASGPAQTARPIAEPRTKLDHTILVVEDDLANQKMAELQLRYLGYMPQIVGDGQAAIRTLQQADAEGREFALVLMDCQMPVMDGFTATREIRQWETQRGLHAIIIAMTANAMQGDREACFAAGMDDYISKPVQIEALKQVLGKWLTLD